MGIRLREFEDFFGTFVHSYYDTSSTELNAACQYALLGPGKRVRPMLVLMFAELFSGKREVAMNAAMAVEMAHCFSLVHDDLPSLDNDDMRRGRLTTHRQFSESTALLVGDALLADAFSVLCLTGHGNLASMVRVLAKAVGGHGMVAGQMIDMAHSQNNQAGNLQQLEQMHLLKTGQLLAACCELGVLCGESVDGMERSRASQFGLSLGLAFQICDDCLDDAPSTGKSGGKDKEQGKLTYVSLLGKEKARELAIGKTEEAVDAIAGLGCPDVAKELATFARTLLDRLS